MVINWEMFNIFHRGLFRGRVIRAFISHSVPMYGLVSLSFSVRVLSVFVIRPVIIVHDGHRWSDVVIRCWKFNRIYFSFNRMSVYTHKYPIRCTQAICILVKWKHSNAKMNENTKNKPSSISYCSQANPIKYHKRLKLAAIFLCFSH